MDGVGFETSGRPQLSVVVCTLSRPVLLRGALASLTEQRLGGDLLEVVVVDNGSDPETGRVVDSFAGRLRALRLVREPRLGLSRARNRGVAESSGRWVAFLDDDARADADWARLILAAFANVQPPPAAVGGVIMPLFEHQRPTWFEDDLELRTWGDQPGFLSGPQARFGFSGSNMAFPRTVLDALGGFSPDYGLVGGRLALGEESHLFVRLHARTPRFWFDPSIRVHHLVPRRNLKVAYRFRRGFAAGRSAARMTATETSVGSVGRELLRVGSELARRVYHAVRLPRRRWRSALLREAQIAGHRLGGLTEHLTGLHARPGSSSAEVGDGGEEGGRR